MLHVWVGDFRRYVNVLNTETHNLSGCDFIFYAENREEYY